MYICSVPKEKANKRITFAFRIPPMGNMKKLGKLHEFIFQLVDTVGGVINLRGEVGEQGYFRSAIKIEIVPGGESLEQTAPTGSGRSRKDWTPAKTRGCTKTKNRQTTQGEGRAGPEESRGPTEMGSKRV